MVLVGPDGRLARAEGDLKEVEERSAAGKTALEKQISLQETLTNLQKDKADEAIKKIASLQVRATTSGLCVRLQITCHNARSRLHAVRCKLPYRTRATQSTVGGYNISLCQGSATPEKYQTRGFSSFFFFLP